MAMFIRERHSEPKDIERVAELADQYLNAHRSWWSYWSYSDTQKGKNSKPFFRKPTNSGGVAKPKESSGTRFEQDKDRSPGGGTHI